VISLARTKAAVATESVEQTTEPVQFTKEQILASATYANRRDSVDALLEESEKYTLKQVDELVNSYMKGKVE
jgi:hypothetical protein